MWKWKTAFALFQIGAASDLLLHQRGVEDAPEAYTQALQDEEPTPDPLCVDLNITYDLNLRGKNFGPLVGFLCRRWPAKFGTFPIRTNEQIFNLLNPLLDKDGIYDQIKAKFKEKNETYCLRQQVQRVKVETRSAVKSCPLTVDQGLLDEIGEEDTNPALKEGFWSCRKGANPTDDDCACTRRDQGGIGTEIVKIQRRPAGCKMVHRGECFGKCPAGYRPSFFIGWFRPVCTNICWETDHPFSCGIGCAVSRGACVRVIFRQILSVISFVSRIVSFFVKGANYVNIAAQVARVAEFALDVVLSVVSAAESIYSLIASREQVGLSLVTAVFQVLQEEVQRFRGFSEQFQGLIGQTTELFLSLVDAEYGWKNVNLNWISGVLTQGPNSTLAAAHEMVNEFAYGKCEVSAKEEAITIEDAGDSRVVGPWQKKGVRNRRPRYVLLNETLARKSRIESTRRNVWNVWILDRSYGRGWWFGWLGFGWRKLYENKVKADEVPTLGWAKKEGALPLPSIVILKDGGESDK